MILTNEASKITSAEVSIVWADSFETNFTGFEDAHFYGSSEYIQALIKGAGERGKFIFPRIYFENECIGFGCLQEITLVGNELDELGRILSSDTSFALKAESILKRALKLSTGRSGLRILVAGNSQVSGPYGLFFKEGIDEQVKTTSWKTMLKSLEIEFEPYHFVLIKDIPLERSELLKTLLVAGYKEIPVLPVMKLSIDKSWDSMEDYLNSFSSKYRIRANAAIKKGSVLVREIWDAEKIMDHLLEVEVLYSQVYEKARFRLFKLDRNYFYELKRRLGDKLEFKAYLLHGKLVGFTTFIQGNGKADAHLIGMDYESNRAYSLYQNMLYDYVGAAISCKSASLDLGRTAMEIKSTVGAVPFDAQVFIKLKNPVFNHIACLFLENIQSEAWVQRHPFKQHAKV
jgi:hypothetical protein